MNIIGGVATGGGTGALGMMALSTAGRKGAEAFRVGRANKVLESLGNRSGLVKETRRIDPKAAYKKAEQAFKERKKEKKEVKTKKEEIKLLNAPDEVTVVNSKGVARPMPTSNEIWQGMPQKRRR